MYLFLFLSKYQLPYIVLFFFGHAYHMISGHCSAYPQYLGTGLAFQFSSMATHLPRSNELHQARGCFFPSQRCFQFFCSPQYLMNAHLRTSITQPIAMPEGSPYRLAIGHDRRQRNNGYVLSPQALRHLRVRKHHLSRKYPRLRYMISFHLFARVAQCGRRKFDKKWFW